MPMEAHFRQGSNNVILACAVKDSEQEIVVLTGATVTLQIRRTAGTFTQSGTVTDAAAGECEFTLTSAGALVSTGAWPAEVLVALPSSVTVMTDAFTFIVD